MFGNNAFFKATGMCALDTGGYCAVAIKRETDPAEVWFNASLDGTVIGTPLLIMTLTDGLCVQVAQNQLNDSSRLVMMNGILEGANRLLKTSDDYGVTWVDVDEDNPL